jgi:hypothetical protein
MITLQKKILLSLLLLLALAGCQFGEQKGTIPDSSSAFEGTEGLVLSFFDGAPPDTLIPKSDFKIAVLLENNGASDITCTGNAEDCGYFRAQETKYIPKITPNSGLLKNALEDISGKNRILGKESYLSGGKAAMEMSASVAATDKTTMSTLTVNACYPYKTKLSVPVCVHTAHYTVPEESLTCKLKTITLQSQGAPVAVKKIEQEPLLQGEFVKPRLKIYISNVGKGVVLDNSSESLAKACTSGGETQYVVGKVVVNEAKLSGIKLDCEGRSIVLRGVSSKDFIECKLTDIPQELTDSFRAGADNNFVSTLNLVLTYGYQTAVSKEIKIEVLDEPPKIKRLEALGTPESGKDFQIFVAAEDDFGLEKIELLDESGEVLTPPDKFTNDCNGRTLCEATFTVKASSTTTYKAKATDTTKKQSKSEELVVEISKPVSEPPPIELPP